MKFRYLSVFLFSTVAFANPPKPSHSGDAPWDKALEERRDADFVKSVVNGDIVISDKTLGWMWQDVHSAPMEWYDAYEFCETSTYAGYSDWKLPTYWQLASIADHKRIDNYIYKAFSDIVPGNALWSRDDSIAIDQPDSDDRWVYFPKTGLLTFEVRTQNLNAKCVRGADPVIRKPTGGSRFIEEKPDLILDTKTGLYWTSGRDTKISKTFLFTAKATFSQANGYCSNLNFAGKSEWRLPNIQELKMILQLDAAHPTTTMPKFPPTMYHLWSSTPAESYDIMWKIDSIGEVLRTNDAVGVFGCVHE